MDSAGGASPKSSDRLAMPRIANVKARDLIRLLMRMRFERYDRDHIYFYHEWLNLWTKISHGDKDIDAALMGRIAIRQLKMNNADEFRAALRGSIPRRYLDPDAPWDGQPLD